MIRKNRTYKLFSLLMAILLFCSSVGFSVDFHYCKGELKSFSLIGSAKTCHDINKVCPRHSTSTPSLEKEKNCCTNKTLIVDNIDQDFTIIQAISFVDIEIVTLATPIPIFTIQDLSDHHIPQFEQYKPPLPKEDFPILFQSFLL